MLSFERSFFLLLGGVLGVRWWLLLFFDVLDEEVVALGEGVADFYLLLAGEVLEEDGLFVFGEGVASEVVVEGYFYFHCCVLCLGSRGRLMGYCGWV